MSWRRGCELTCIERSLTLARSFEKNLMLEYYLVLARFFVKDDRVTNKTRNFKKQFLMTLVAVATNGFEQSLSATAIEAVYCGVVRP